MSDFIQTIRPTKVQLGSLSVRIMMTEPKKIQRFVRIYSWVTPSGNFRLLVKQKIDQFSKILARCLTNIQYKSYYLYTIFFIILSIIIYFHSKLNRHMLSLTFEMMAIWISSETASNQTRFLVNLKSSKDPPLSRPPFELSWLYGCNYRRYGKMNDLT